jgi:hypothetical protein
MFDRFIHVALTYKGSDISPDVFDRFDLIRLIEIIKKSGLDKINQAQ